MATEQPKTASTPEHPFPPGVPYHPQPFNGTAYPPPGPPGAYPPYFAYPPPPPDGNHAENGPNGVPPVPPYMMAFPPPSMVYAFPPPPGQGYQAPQSNQMPPALTRPKRKQVKMACTNCAAACKRCDETRPCERCMKYGVADTCVDGQRKERKKGIKRGPYKRKNKANTADPSTYGGSGEGEWAPGSQSPASAATTTAAIHAVAQFTAPEGYYPVYYPPPGPYMPPLPDGQPAHDGVPPHPNGQPPMVPYYIHPGAYPPFPHHYPHPGVYPPPGTPGGPPQAQTVNPADTAKKGGSSTPGSVNGASESSVAAAPSKRKARGGKGDEPKAKRAKITRSGRGAKGDGTVVENDDGEGDAANGI